MHPQYQYQNGRRDLGQEKQAQESLKLLSLCRLIQPGLGFRAGGSILLHQLGMEQNVMLTPLQSCPGWKSLWRGTVQGGWAALHHAGARTQRGRRGVWSNWNHLCMCLHGTEGLYSGIAAAYANNLLFCWIRGLSYSCGNYSHSIENQRNVSANI